MDQEAVTDIAQVTRFQVGDRVHTLFTQGHFAGDFTPKLFSAGLGGAKDGVFRRYGVFNEEGLIPIPEEISYEDAATLPCAAVTAWNALYGLRQLLPGDVVLTQGTGGVSLFVLQFAKAAGATVICTTSSTEKADVLRTLGADHVLVYEHNPEWGQLAKRLTLDGRGVDHVVDVGGTSTIDQSLKAVKIGGVVHMIGFLGGRQGGPSCLEVFSSGCVVRSVIVGSRALHEQCVSSPFLPLVKLTQCKVEVYRRKRNQACHSGKTVQV
jgi:NADPH:quinone reductase-like Zn-dependent oxidoreductase